MLKQYIIWSLKIQNYLASGLLILLTTVVFLQVIARKIIPIPMPWTEELGKLSLIWITYLGLAATFKQDFHIRVDLIDGLFKAKISKYVMDIFINFMGILFAGLIIYYALVYILEQLEFNQHLSVTSLPMWVVLLPILLGGILTAIHFLITFILGILEMRNQT